jgi:hypothetical protein
MAKEKSELTKKAEALKVAAQIGCSGAHKSSDGEWMPCSSMDELNRISETAETGKWRSVVPGYKKSEDKSRSKGKRKKRPKDWENLTEKPIMGIVSIDSGLVSGNLFGAKEVNPCWDGYVMQGMKKGKKGKLVPNCVPIKTKSAVGPEFVRESDSDVFLDPESARARSRQIGCIGISRRVSKNGRAVWMPCTNMTDYANRVGTTSLGRRNIEKNKKREMERATRTVVADLDSRRPKRKVALIEQLKNK